VNTKAAAWSLLGVQLCLIAAVVLLLYLFSGTILNGWGKAKLVILLRREGVSLSQFLGRRRGKAENPIRKVIANNRRGD
jgi:hypothetical protein